MGCCTSNLPLKSDRIRYSNKVRPLGLNQLSIEIIPSLNLLQPNRTQNEQKDRQMEVDPMNENTSKHLNKEVPRSIHEFGNIKELDNELNGTKEQREEKNVPFSAIEFGKKKTTKSRKICQSNNSENIDKDLFTSTEEDEFSKPKSTKRVLFLSRRNRANYPILKTTKQPVSLLKISECESANEYSMREAELVSRSLGSRLLRNVSSFQNQSSKQKLSISKSCEKDISPSIPASCLIGSSVLNYKSKIPGSSIYPFKSNKFGSVSPPLVSANSFRIQKRSLFSPDSKSNKNERRRNTQLKEKDLDFNLNE